MADVCESPNRLAEAIKLVRHGDIEGLAALYMSGFDVLDNYKILACWASESGMGHITLWLDMLRDNLLIRK